MKAIMLYMFIFLQAVSASQSRGVWFWRTSSSPYGSDNIVGNSVLEGQTVSFLSARNVKRVYGSYGTRPVDEPTVIAAWNTKLHNAGISSQALFAEPSWVETANRPNLLTKISARVIDFNTAPGRTYSEQFKAVHLDIEPQQLPGWDSGTSTNKREYLTLLLETYIEVRDHLDTAGQTGVGLYADLPVWYDKLPVDGGSVAWADATDRDDWYAAIGVPLSGVSLMAFQRDTFSNIDGAVDYERASVPGATVRTAIQADVGSGATWADIADFKSMMDTLETAYGFSGAVDIENYRLWREVVAAQPLAGVSVQYKSAANLTGIEFDVATNGTYVILHSTNLCNWHEVKRVRAPSQNSTTNIPVSTADDRGFWQIYRFEDRKELE